VEAQATDRAHRIGQTQVVTSIKLIARDTVEQRVLALQDKKRALFENAIDADQLAATLDLDDIRELIG
jgi:SNF2 family DNA or RNA helicase